MAHGQFRKGWRESDIEDCARLMVSLIKVIFLVN